MLNDSPPVRRPLRWPFLRWSIPPFCCPLLPPMPMMTSWGPSRYTCSSRQSHWTLANLPWEDEWPKNGRRVVVNKRPRVHCHFQTESKEVFLYLQTYAKFGLTLALCDNMGCGAGHHEGVWSHISSIASPACANKWTAKALVHVDHTGTKNASLKSSSYF